MKTTLEFEYPDEYEKFKRTLAAVDLVDEHEQLIHKLRAELSSVRPNSDRGELAQAILNIIDGSSTDA